MISGPETPTIHSSFDPDKPKSFHVQAEAQGKNLFFLIDTGADLSILPKTQFNPDDTNHKKLLKSANNTTITYHGQTKVTFTIEGFKGSFKWNFSVADVSKPILGADFLAHFNISVNCQNCTIFNPVSKESCKGIKHLTSEDQHETHEVKSHRPNVKMRIETEGPPVAQRSRKLFGEKLKAAKLEFDKLLAQGILIPSNSSWAAPITMVKKSDGSWRPCGDYRQLNNITKADKYPLPRIHDLIDSIQSPKMFSRLDLSQAYHQIPIAAEDRHKTAVITPFGLFEYTHMPFGLKNSSQVFQRFMDNVLRNTQTFCINYVDDILIFSNNEFDHKTHIKIITEKLTEAGLAVNQTKCLFSVKEVDFLGFRLTQNGSAPKLERIEAIRNMKIPKDVKQLKQFIGTINYYRHMISNLSQLLSPLHNLSTAATKSKQLYRWTETESTAFEAIKAKLTSATMISYIDKDKPFILCTDASGVAVGASLNQIQSTGAPTPIGFFSRKLNHTEQKYSTFDRELLAIYLSVKNFKHYLDGNTFTIRTDHKPLLHIKTMKDPSTRQWRYIEFLTQFSFQLEHIRGQDNIVADLLSRADVAPISIEELIQEQTKDPTLSDIGDTSLILSHTPEGILIDSSYDTKRFVLPQKYRHAEFKRLHNLSHPGTRPMIELIRSRYIWPKMKTDVRKWCRECVICQKSKITRHTKAPLGTIPTIGRFKTLHLDIVGPLPKVGNKLYILTMIDRATSWIEAVPMAEITAKAVVQTLNDTWVCRFGPPEILITDQGLQFESEIFNSYCNRIGCKHRRTTAYHPQTNGKIERWHRSLKNSLRTFSENPEKSWPTDLPRILLSLRNCTTSDGKASPTQLTFGYQTRLPGDLAITSTDLLIDSEDNNDLQQKILQHQKKGSDRKVKHKSFVSKDLFTCEKVWIRKEQRKTLENPYHGPYNVISRSSDMKTFDLMINGEVKTVSIDRMKPVVEAELAPPTGGGVMLGHNNHAYLNNK